MENNAIKKLDDLTLAELELVNQFLTAPTKAIFIEGKKRGIIASLHKKEIVDKLIRVGRVWRWRLKEKYSVLPVRKFIKEKLWRVY